jgi:ketosteroid isomerase-like protein
VNSEDIFQAFVAAINVHDADALVALMATDHLFVDGLGNRVAGSGSMKAGWSGYFAMCPDYWIRVDTVASESNVVLAVGEAGGTIDGAVWKTPAAWKAVIREDKMAEWRVFADNSPVHEILARRS